MSLEEKRDDLLDNNVFDENTLLLGTETVKEKKDNENIYKKEKINEKSLEILND